MRRIESFLKRTLDLASGILGRLVLALLFAVVALAVKLGSRGPVFFRQERVGNGQQPRLVVH